jgi:cytochrome c551
MKLKLSALLLGTSIILGACSSGEEEEATGETTTADAETITQQSCIGCHGQNLGGGSAPPLTEVGAKYSKDEIKDILINGKGGMPSGLLDDAKAEVVAQWLAEKK